MHFDGLFLQLTPISIIVPAALCVQYTLVAPTVPFRGARPSGPRQGAAWPEEGRGAWRPRPRSGRPCGRGCSRRSPLLGTLRDRQAEERHRSDLLVAPLLGPQAEVLDLPPVVGRYHPPPSAPSVCHALSPSFVPTRCVVEGERCHVSGSRTTPGWRGPASPLSATGVTDMCSTGRG